MAERSQAVHSLLSTAPTSTTSMTTRRSRSSSRNGTEAEAGTEATADDNTAGGSGGVEPKACDNSPTSEAAMLSHFKADLASGTRSWICLLYTSPSPRD